MTINMKFDRQVERSILRQLDAIQRKHGSRDTRHAVNKWNRTQADLVRLAKKQKALQKELDEVNRRLK